MGKKKGKNERRHYQYDEDIYTFNKETLKCLINDSIGEVQNADLLNYRTKSLIAWLRANTDIQYVRENRNRKIGF